jgi:hypothetical protein
MTELMAHDPLAALGGTRRAYVVPDLKVLYISVAKNACTTIKWLVSELAGEDPAQFALGAGPWVSRDEGIHMRSRWQHTPTLGQVPSSLRAEISPDNGWFVFGVVRDPRSRLFSAWQNKFLMRNPAYVQWHDEPWYPRVPESPQDIVEDFARFVEVLHRDPQARVADDAHFQPQTPLLAEHVVPYSRIYEIGQLGTMVTDLDAHLRGQGWSGDVVLRQSNDTPLRASAAAFAGPVREQVESFYAADFERFGDLWDFAKLEASPLWSEETMAGVRARIAMAERISDLRSQLQRARRRNVAERDQNTLLRKQLAQARASNRKLRAAASDPAWKRAARPVLRRVRARLAR